MQLTYVAPSGESFSDFDIASLLPFVRNGGSSYWNIGSGGGLLSCGAIGDLPSMEIYFIPRKGFHLIFNESGRAQVAAEPRDEIDDARWAQIYIGGEATRISTRQVIGRKQAEEALRHFCNHCTVSPDLRWSPVR